MAKKWGTPKVLKFGGTSVGSVEVIQKLPTLVERERDDGPIILVVSAFSGVTNSLSSLASLSLDSFSKAEEKLDELRGLHHEVSNELIGGEDNQVFIDELFNDIQNVCKGISLLKEVTKKSEDFIITCGELLSSRIINSYLEKHFKTQLFNAKDYLVTPKSNKHGRVNRAVSLRKIDGIKELNEVNVFPGFIASSEDGTTTSLGRGGSDFTASLLANFFDAKELVIWTDVDGIMSADPRYVRQAKVLEHLSYEEALEISHFGAKVIYPPSIQPALAKGIPIRIKNTFSPEKNGTLITKEWDESKSTIQGISSIKEIVMINMMGAGMVGIPSISSRFFKALSDREISIIMITQASSEHSICVAISKAEEALALEGLQEEFQIELDKKLINEIEIEKDLAIVALVGSNMRNQVGVSGRMFNTLGKNGISVKAIAQGSSERNISTIIPEKDLKKALNTLHESFFLSERKRVNLFVVGVGNVGKTFLEQVRNQTQYLLDEHNLLISVVSIANSRKMVFRDEGLDLSGWQQQLDEGEVFDFSLFIEKMKDLNMRNSIFVDGTASDKIARKYETILRNSISVVTPNKLAATGAYEDYQNLLDLSLKNNVQFLFETNVAAGLPVISTLKDLIKSGDRILRIEAVLSGTLNYLFNTYDGTVPFHEVIQDAKTKGLTEPDPRLDLFGEDVMRKILILARESGHSLEMKEVSYTSFLPESCTKAYSIEDFYSEVQRHEAHFQQLYRESTDQGEKLRVVATLEEGKANVSLKSVGDTHPFFHLEGKDNIVLFYTNRYKEQPLVIKGAGAGADVTASGIFADILKVSLN